MRLFKVLVVPVALLALAGCSKNSSDPTAPPVNGQISVAITDAPADYDAVNLVVTEVAVNRGSGDSGWEVLSSTPQTVNLLTLQNGLFTSLAAATVPSGTFMQLRLMLGAGSNVVVDGVSYPLTIPSGMQTGLKLNGSFTVPADGALNLQMDFDAAQSITQSGAGVYILNPVVRVLAENEAGSISGLVVTSGSPTSVTVSQNGTEVCTNWANADGSFKVAVLLPGTYTVRLTNEANVIQYDTVVVSAGSTTSMGRVSFIFENPTAPPPGESPVGGGI